MKRLLAVFAVVAALGFATSALAQDTKVTLQVQGWHCAHCVQETAEALEKVHGVERAYGDLKKGTVTVEYSPRRTNVDTLKKVIAKAGFKVVEKKG